MDYKESREKKKKSKQRAEELIILNCGVGEDS